MRMLITYLLIAAALFFGGRWLYQKFVSGNPQAVVRDRLTDWMENMKEGGDEKVAASQWASGHHMLDGMELSSALQLFGEWRSRNAIRYPISRWSIDVVDIQSDPPTAVVTMNNDSYKISVPPGSAIGIIQQ